ncbi:MAG TPA: DUF971 domain-containing protein [Rhizomicrobium sp.]|nr:DUF971 domain-containing protein [Rhizomicrobium sp.]
MKSGFDASGVMQASWPTEIRLNPARDVLTVAFENGERFALRAEYLRVESPSAEVRGHGGPKKIVLGKEQVKIEALEPVGNYAVRIGFDDGHDSGLYSWDYLCRLGREEARIWGEYLAAKDGAGVKPAANP